MPGHANALAVISALAKSLKEKPLKLVRDLAEDGSQKRARMQPCWPAAVVLRPPAGSQACLLTASPVDCPAGSQPRWLRPGLVQILAGSKSCCLTALLSRSLSPPLWFTAAGSQP